MTTSYSVSKGTGVVRLGGFRFNSTSLRERCSRLYPRLGLDSAYWAPLHPVDAYIYISSVHKVRLWHIVGGTCRRDGLETPAARAAHSSLFRGLRLFLALGVYWAPAGARIGVDGYERIVCRCAIAANARCRWRRGCGARARLRWKILRRWPLSPLRGRFEYTL